MMDEIYEHLLHINFAEDLFAELKKTRRVSATQFIACCPFHADKNPSFSYSITTPLWTCFAGCGSGNWQTYIERKLGLSPSKAIEYLAKAAGVETDGLTNQLVYEETRQRSVLNEAFHLFKREIFNPDTSDVLYYLVSRRYTEAQVKAMELGRQPNKNILIQHLRSKGFSHELIKEVFPLIDWREDYKLVIPQRDRFGNLSGFVGRVIDPKIKKNKYKPNTGNLSKDSLFNIHTVPGFSSVTIVEGYFDALFAQVNGFNPIAAITKANFSQDQLDRLEKMGVNQVTLCFDSDEAGVRCTQKAVELCARNTVDCFVADLRDDKVKDPDEFIHAKGIEAFKDRVAAAQLGTDWLVRSFLAEADLSSPKGVQAFVMRALEFSARSLAKNSREKASYLKIIAETLKCNEQALLIEERKYLLQHSTHDNESDTQIQPNANLAAYLGQKQQRDSKRTGTLLGLQVGVFKQLQEHTFGIQPGFYIVAADTNIGKTAFLTNIFLEAILSNPATIGLYVSLDDGKDTIINRFLSILTGIDLVRVQLSQQKSDDQQKLSNAYATLTRLAEEGRFDLKDIAEISDVQQFETLIAKLSENAPIIVAIDGLYNLSVGEKSSGIREENITRAAQIKRIVDTYQIPVITTGELRKKASDDKNSNPTLHDLMETSKFAYNANLVWLIYPQAAVEFKRQAEPTLILEYAKNKLSHFKGVQLLKFTKDQGKITEMSSPTLTLLPRNAKKKGD